MKSSADELTRIGMEGGIEESKPWRYQTSLSFHLWGSSIESIENRSSRRKWQRVKVQLRRLFFFHLIALTHRQHDLSSRTDG